MGRCKREQAEMCVKAVLAVADLERKDVNLDLIKVSTLVRPQDLLWKPCRDEMWGVLSQSNLQHLFFNWLVINLPSF